MILVHRFEERNTMFGWIPGTMSIPLPDIEAGAVPHIPKDASILMICRSGRRSEKAIGIIAAKGFTNLTNLEGGTQKWASDGLPTVDPAKEQVFVDTFKSQTASNPEPMQLKVRDAFVDILNACQYDYKKRYESATTVDSKKYLKQVFEGVECSWDEPTKSGIVKAVNLFEITARSSFDPILISEAASKMMKLAEII